MFSPLLNLRLVEALRGLRERGFATVVVDVLCAAHIGAGRVTRTRPWPICPTRIWRMEQDAIRFSLRELGIPVVTWDGVARWTSRSPLLPDDVMVNRA